MIARESDVASVNSRLEEAAATGELVEVIVVVRGSIGPATRADHWRIRGEGRTLTFPAACVVAVTREEQRGASLAARRGGSEGPGVEPGQGGI